MNKKIIICLFLLNIFQQMFSMTDEEFEINYKSAIELSNEQFYSESIKLYAKLLDERTDFDIIMNYSDVLARSGNYKQAVNILEKYIVGAPEEYKEKYILLIAKYCGWNKEYKKAYMLYKQRIESHLALDEYGESFVLWYKGYKKMEGTYLIGWNMQNDKNTQTERNHNLSVSYNDFGKYTLVFSGEFNHKNDTWNNLISGEIYMNNYHFSIGGGNENRYYSALEKTYGIFTFGIKYDHYFDKEDLLYKIQADNILFGLNFTNRINFIQNLNSNIFSTNFASQMEINNFRTIVYFDLKKQTKLFFKYKIEDILDFISIESAICRDFEIQTNGISLATGIKF